MLTVRNLLNDDIKALTGEAGLDNKIMRGYVCDLLSWVMSHGDEGTAWVTAQNHLNVVAVATMIDAACVILPEGITAAEDVLQKAADEGIAVLSSGLTGFELAVALDKQLKS